MSQWALVEVMGHAKYAGVLDEVAFAGAMLWRVRIPEVVVDDVERDYMGRRRTRRRTFSACSVEGGGAAIFRVHRPIREEVARALVPECDRPADAAPVYTYGEWAEEPRGVLPGPSAVEDAQEVPGWDDDMDDRDDNDRDDL